MADPFMGEIRMVGFDFPPKGWALCDGKMLNSEQHSSLYSLLGNAFGGDQTNFALPDLRGRFPIGAGLGEGLTSYSRGEKGGVEEVSLQPEQLPAHSHALKASSSEANSQAPSGRLLADLKGKPFAYTDAGADTTMSSSAIANMGGDHPHENMPPHQAINFIIALVGNFPQRD
jgi:microcystin-dependent protein